MSDRILTTGIKSLDLSLIDRDKCTASYTSGYYMNKPRSGALYGSTFLVEENYNYSSWLMWCMDSLSNKNVSYGVSYKLKENAKILEMPENLLDYYRLLSKYLFLGEDCCYGQRAFLDYTRICKDYDAVHVSIDSAYNLRFVRSEHDRQMPENIRKYIVGDLYSYDVETWIIFNPDAIDLNSIHYHDEKDLLTTEIYETLEF